VLRKGESSIRKVIFSCDSRFLASITEESSVDIYDVELGECIHSIICKSIQNSIAWNPKNLLLAHCGEEKNRNNLDDGSIHIFGL
jgi:WD40 repeat protein